MWSLYYFFFSDLMWSRFVSPTIYLMFHTSVVFCLRLFSLSSRTIHVPQFRHSSVQCCTQVTCVKSESSPKSLGSSLKSSHKSLGPSPKSLTVASEVASLGTNFKSVSSLYRLKYWKFTCRPCYDARAADCLSFFYIEPSYCSNLKQISIQTLIKT